jgi:hypothetical protein
MPALLSLNRAARHGSVDKAATEWSPQPSFGWFAWPALVLLAGYLLFCHGCHGDEDNELLANASAMVAAHEKAHGRWPVGLVNLWDSITASERASE